MLAVEKGKMKRELRLEALREKPEVSVLIIGGGVNGIGTFRDLALQGVDALLVERGDFCSGTSAGSSHMLHGGLRYLENGEFRLVNEALHERDRLLENAPHYAKPLRTTIPIFRWFSGTLNAPLKFFGLLDRPGERGALVIKAGLTLYDWFVRAERKLPKHEFRRREAALRAYPKLNPDIVCAASYYDAWMPYPERICLEMILDAEAGNSECRALNYVSAVAGGADTVTLRDDLSGDCYTVKPRLVVNAGGPWIDFVNRRLGQGERRFISGTKGSHLVLDHRELLEALAGSEFYFENDDGRPVLMLPYLGRVLIGTTDIRIDDPDEAVISEDEIDYILGLAGRVFPAIALDREQIVFSFSAVRPLPTSEAGRTGQISRDHSIRSLPADADCAYPIHSLVGGKWTTFRAFAEETTDVVLGDLGLQRRQHTRELAIGGGRDYPRGEGARAAWLGELGQRTGLPPERLGALFERFGTRAADVAEFITCADDVPLAHHASYSRREIEFIARHERLERLDDLVLRRTALAMRGDLTRALLEELAGICADVLGWTAGRKADELARTLGLLRDRHRVHVVRPD